MMRFCILGASLGTGNMGVSALASGTVAAALHAYPDGEVFLLDYGHVPECHHVRTKGREVAVRLVNLRFSKKLYLRNNIARLLVVAFISRLLPARWRHRWCNRYPACRAILGAGTIASLAGGDSFSDIYGIGRLLYVALPQILVLQLGQPLILLPQTLGPFKSRAARAIARYIMNRATLVCSRDHHGLAVAEAILGGVRKHCRFSPDMAFVLEAALESPRLSSVVPKRQRGSALVGINVSGLLLMGGYDRRNMFGLKASYSQLVEQLVEHFIQHENCDVLLVPHVFGDDSENDSDACRWLHERLQSRFGNKLHLLTGRYDQHEIKWIIGSCDFFIGARMHACIAAVSQCVPALCLAYSRKFLGVMETLGMPELVADLCALDTGEVLTQAREVFAVRDQLHATLRQRVPQVRAAVLNLFSAAEPTNPSDAGVEQRGGKGEATALLNENNAPEVIVRP